VWLIWASLLACSQQPPASITDVTGALQWRKGPWRRYKPGNPASLELVFNDGVRDFSCQVRWPREICTAAFIHCASELDAESMRLVAELDWTSGRLWFARLDVGHRTYGGASHWINDAERFVYVFRPATVDPETNELHYAKAAKVAAAATLGSDGTELGVRRGESDATELVLASRIVVTIALLGFAKFEQQATCSHGPRLL
jgi:hypothetical protein